MGLNPQYNDENDWEVVSSDEPGAEDTARATGNVDETINETEGALSQQDLSGQDLNEIQVMLPSEEEVIDLIVTDINENREEEAEPLILVSPPGTEELESSMQETDTHTSADDTTTEETGDNNITNTNENREDEAEPLILVPPPQKEDAKSSIPESVARASANDTAAKGTAETPVSKESQPSMFENVGSSFRNFGKSIGMESEKRIDRRIGRSAKNLGETISSAGKAIDMESDKRIDRKIGNSMKDLGKSISEETQKFGKAIGMESEKRIDRRILRVFSGKHEQFQQQQQQQQPGQPMEKTHEISTLANVFAAATAIGGGILLAKGNKGAGATLLATGGAAYVAGEAMREKHARRHSTGLNEELGLHMD